MPRLGPTARRVLGLPDPGDWERRKQRKLGKQGQAAPAAVPQQAVNPWETAAQQLLEQRTAPTPVAPLPGTRPAEPAPTAPWATVEERSGSAFARRLGRGVLWTLVAAFALLGAKSVLIPKKAPDPVQSAAPAKTAPAYPADEARVTASRFARAYLAWDEKDPAARAAGLAAVLPEGADATMGWDGKGNQDVLAVEASTVTPAAQQQARVRVDVLVRPTTPATPPKPGTAPAPVLPAHWLGLEVPVVQASGRVIVTGPPGIVGVPTTGPKAPELAAPEADSAFGEQTTETITQFFTAYAAGDTETVTAPGTVVPPLPAGVSLVEVASWTADKGTGPDRTGTARVTWQMGGAQLEQTYRVELTRVASADAQRWQVAAVHGGTA
ncbi:conjugal transfer protein [Streptomyces sp. NPDC051079]|uniref:conjugal transfer protein n=1 Tax=Streptomyces sp. NPDC051079 TaxID=3155043 RepID=UPI00345028C7